ncbi:hypothetical protein [Pontibacter vulgaris]|uniref:hypothetical protein n=1 Tax=Pontibacter vulgaris TaxID=2905679 RepID=UPI001FA77854|nr:hypothetical protein [Pontibacter vulgaris]
MNTIYLNRIAVAGLLFILSLFVLFHLAVMLSIIPLNMVWGGELKTKAQMLPLETIAIVINLIMLAVVSIKAGILKLRVNETIIRAALWIMFVLFLFNTAGNALSVNKMEKLLFTPLTFLLSIFSLILALNKRALLQIK